MLYISEADEGSFAETFVRDRTNSRPVMVTERQLRDRALSELSWDRYLMLADLTSNQLGSLGLDSRIANGDCYELAQRWALWFHNHPTQVDGIMYLARNAPRVVSVALFERAGNPASVTLLEPPLLVGPGLLSDRVRKLVSEFGVALVST